MWLIGMMGSGKTTCGEAAARHVGVPFFDTDQMVVELAGLPIPAIWDRVGEEGFRRLEARAVADVPESDFIGAAGGGAILSAENREHMARGAPVVWLRCHPDVLARRVDGDHARPLLDGSEDVIDALTRLLAERSPLYEEVATDVVDTDLGPVSAVVTELIEIWQR